MTDKDYRAQYGSMPTWDLQQEKQARAAENNRQQQEPELMEVSADGSCPYCGSENVAGVEVLQANREKMDCGECGNLFVNET